MTEKAKNQKKGRDYKKEYLREKDQKAFIGLHLMRSTDADLLEYIETKTKEGYSKQGLIKEALREKQQREG